MSELINFSKIATEWNRGGARRALAELDRQGYQIVPKEPTKDMVGRIWDVVERNDGSYWDAYLAMLAAAPKVTE